MPKSKRGFLKAYQWSKFEQINSDQQLGLPRPELQKATPPNAVLIDLVPPGEFTVGGTSTIDVIRDRVSHRQFTKEHLTLEELSFLLWATQGVRDKVFDGGITYVMRNVPSGGNRHPIETYLSIHHVEGIQPGLYRYLPIDHKLVQEKLDPDLSEQVKQASLNQNNGSEAQPYYFIKEAAVVFIWTAIPYRSEWRYHTAAASIGAGTCAVGAYDQLKMNQLLDVDGEDEFVIYMAPVGKISKRLKA